MSIEALGGPTVVKTTVEKDVTIDEKKKKLGALMMQGQLDFDARSFGDAAKNYGEAARLSSECFGETGGECFQSHFAYGNALLQYGRAETQMTLTDTNKAHDKTSHDLEGEGDSMVKVIDFDSLSNGSLELAEEVCEEELKENGSKLVGTEKKEEKQTELESEKTDETILPEKDDEVDFSSEIMEEQEHTHTIEVAFQILESTRLICESQEKTRKWDLRRAEVLVLLAECWLEYGKYKEAISDVNSAVKLQLQHQADGRVLSRSYSILSTAWNLKSTGVGVFQQKEGLFEKRSAPGDSCIGGASVTEDEKLVQKFEDLHNLPHAPSVQMQPIGNDTMAVAIRYLFEDHSDPHKRLPSAIQDKIVEGSGEFFDGNKSTRDNQSHKRPAGSPVANAGEENKKAKVDEPSSST